LDAAPKDSLSLILRWLTVPLLH